MSTLTQESTQSYKSTENYAQFGPKLKTPLPGPLAQKAVAADERLVSPSYTRSYPMVAKSGRGIRVTDVDGNEFLDFAAGIAVNSTGHCHPEVVKAIQDQAAELIHMSGTDFYYEHMTTLAERLSAIAPMPGGRSRWATSSDPAGEKTSRIPEPSRWRAMSPTPFSPGGTE